MSIRIIKAGFADTVQDLGRYGFQHLGINPGGAMDAVAAQVANMLTGNDIYEAVIEFHFPASSIMFEKDCLIAISGADFGVTTNHQSIPLNTPVIVAKKSVLEFSKYISGCRCYLAVRNGIDIPLWLNSYSTHVKAHAGGYKGRILHKDDLLITRKSASYQSVLKKNRHDVLHWKADVAEFYQQPNIIRICTGKEYGELTDQSKSLLTTADFLVTPHSDRMGYRLVSVILQRNQNTEIISSAVTRGVIQLFPNGQLVILMADHQTAGGYPVIAHVISADMPKLAQLNSNQTIQFQMIEAAGAEDLLWQQYQHLHQLQNACNLRLEEYFLHHALY